MRLLLDECLPKQLKRQFPGHVVSTVPEAGLAGVKNGMLLKAPRELSTCSSPWTETFASNRISTASLGILVLRAVSNDMSDLLPLVPAAREALDQIRSGVVMEIGS